MASMHILNTKALNRSSSWACATSQRASCGNMCLQSQYHYRRLSKCLQLGAVGNRVGIRCPACRLCCAFRHCGVDDDGSASKHKSTQQAVLRGTSCKLQGILQSSVAGRTAMQTMPGLEIRWFVGRCSPEVCRRVCTLSGPRSWLWWWGR